MSKKKRRYGLEPHRVVYAAREFVDFDYENQLSEADQDWLNQFSSEYYNNYFSKGADHLFKTKEQKRECYTRNNERRRDMWTNFHRMPHDYTDMIKTEENGDDE